MFRYTVLASALLATAAPAFAQQTYVLTDIAYRNGDLFGNGININATGRIAGYTANSPGGNNMPYAWAPSAANSPTGVLSMLPLPSGSTSGIATGINSAGLACGTATTVVTTKKGNKVTETSTTSPLVWQANGSSNYLTNGGARIAGSLSHAYGINDSGEVVGDFGLWVNGTVYSLPGVRALSINNGGQVAGLMTTSIAANEGYLWTPFANNGTGGSYVNLPFWAGDVNNLGQVVGAPIVTGGGAAAVYSASSGTQYLMPPGTQCGAGGINNYGVVVGGNLLSSGYYAYIWDRVNGVRNLNDPTQFTIQGGAGWNLVWAEGINDAGQIVGWGVNPAGVERYFLLTPQ